MMMIVIIASRSILREITLHWRLLILMSMSMIIFLESIVARVIILFTGVCAGAGGVVIGRCRCQCRYVSIVRKRVNELLIG